MRALAPLHPRPPAARQGGQPARHGLRPRGAQPERHPAADRGSPRAASSLIDTELGILERETAAGADHATRRDELTAEQPRVERRTGRAADALGGRTRARDARSTRCAAASRPPAPPNRARQAALSRRRRQRRPGRPRQAGGARRRAARAAGRTAADAVRVVDGQAVAEVVAGWTGIPVGKMVATRSRPCSTCAKPWSERVIGQAHALEADRAGASAPPRRPDRSAPADRRLPAGRHRRASARPRRPSPRRPALRRRAEHDRRSTCRSSRRSTRSRLLMGSPARLRRLRRGRRADRGGPPPALQRRAARRGGEGPSGRAGALLLRSSTRA